MREQKGFWQTVLKTVAANKAAEILIVVALLGVTGSSAHAEGDPPTPRIILKWFDTYGLVSSSAEATGKHVVSVFERIGVSVIWDKDRTVSPQPGELELWVLLRPSEPESLGLPANTMGAILNNKSPQRTLFIFFPAVARVLGYKPEDLAGQPLRGQELVLARGMSRVIVHEVMHAVAPNLPHASEGLTRQRLDRDDVAYSKAMIDPRSAAVFREELAKQLTVQSEKVAAYSALRSSAPDVASIALATELFVPRAVDLAPAPGSDGGQNLSVAPASNDISRDPRTSREPDATILKRKPGPRLSPR